MTSRVRAMDADGDMKFGHGQRDFLIDSPAAVAQVVLTRLQMWTNQFFLNMSDGTPYLEQVLGKSNENSRDTAIRQRILDTPYVTSIANFFTDVNTTTRAWRLGCILFTAFGQIDFVAQGGPGSSGPFKGGSSPSGIVPLG